MSPDRAWARPLEELTALRGHGMQVAQYLAVLAGIRRSLDDWVPGPQFAAYREQIARLGLALEIDCAFLPIAEPQHVVGLEYAPTTRFLGRPYTAAIEDDPEASIHVVVASRADWAAETLAAGWYPLVIDNRVTYKPRVDFLRLGLALGYPECCVRFFLEHNDWPRQSTLAESARASSALDWRANCIPKNTPWMLIFHMPCSFDCAATLEYSTALMREIEGFDRRLADRIEGFLRQTFLVVTERLCFRLVDASTNGSARTRYAHADSLHRDTSLRDPQEERYCQAFDRGDEVSIADGTIFIWKQGELADAIATRCDRGIAEVPLLLSFTGP